MKTLIHTRADPHYGNLVANCLTSCLLKMTIVKEQASSAKERFATGSRKGKKCRIPQKRQRTTEETTTVDGRIRLY